jgi:hypothetical protein
MKTESLLNGKACIEVFENGEAVPLRAAIRANNLFPEFGMATDSGKDLAVWLLGETI